MKTADAIAWFKRTFADRIEAGLAGTPFSVDLVAAIANQETGYIWSPLVTKGFSESDILRLCVGDTLDADRGRACFPRNKAELLAAPRGAEMFAIARQALLDMASHVNGYEAATINPNKFCHGYGIFQYDLQFYRENPEYFLRKRWADFAACLTQFVDELKQAAKRQGWADKRSLSDEQRIFIAIAYNKGKADCALGFKQGHKCDGRCYGENVYDFFRIAQGIPINGATAAVRLPTLPLAPLAPPPVFKKMGVVYEVDVEEVPLRLRSEPRVSEPNPGANVIARLARGQLVQQVSRKKTGEFLEVATIFEGVALRGFASTKFLRRVERARRVRPSPKTRSRLPAAALKSTETNTAKRKEVNVAPSPPETSGELLKSMDIEAIIRAVQKELGLEVDGKAGPRTWKAIYLKIKGKAPEDTEAPLTTQESTAVCDRLRRCAERENHRHAATGSAPVCAHTGAKSGLDRDHDQGHQWLAHLRRAKRALCTGKDEIGATSNKRARRIFQSQLRDRIRYRDFQRIELHPGIAAVQSGRGAGKRDRFGVGWELENDQGRAAFSTASALGWEPVRRRNAGRIARSERERPWLLRLRNS